MSVPAAIANAVADALGRDDVEPPFTPGRVWELLQPMKPAPFEYVRPEYARGGARGCSPRAATRRRCSPAARASSRR